MQLRTQKPKNIYLIGFKEGPFLVRGARPNVQTFPKGTKFFVCHPDMTLEQLETLGFHGYDPKRAGLEHLVEGLDT